MAAQGTAVIRIDAIWLAGKPLDMRAGTDTALARVVKVFGAARPHHAYLFANKNGTRMKVLVYDGFGLWLVARRLNRGRFVWAEGTAAATVALNAEQLQALVIGLPWKTLATDHALRPRTYAVSVPIRQVFWHIAAHAFCTRPVHSHRRRTAPARQPADGGDAWQAGTDRQAHARDGHPQAAQVRRFQRSL